MFLWVGAYITLKRDVPWLPLESDIREVAKELTFDEDQAEGDTVWYDLEAG